MLLPTRNSQICHSQLWDKNSGPVLRNTGTPTPILFPIRGPPSRGSEPRTVSFTGPQLPTRGAQDGERGRAMALGTADL